MSELETPIPTEKEIRDLLPGYVLGNLDADELLSVSNHLSNYPALLEEVRTLEHTTMQLAYHAPAARPPTGSRERILARARVDKDHASANASAANSASESPFRTSVTPPNAATSSTTSMVRYAPTAPSQHTPLPRQSWLGRFGEWWSNSLGWKMYALATSTALVLLALIFNQTQLDLQQSLVQITDLENTSSQTESQRVAIESERDSLVVKLAVQGASYDELQAENNALITSLKSTLQTLDTANTELRDTVTQVEASNTAFETANAQLEASNTQLGQENIRLAQENTQLGDENTQLTAGAATFEEEKATLQEAVDQLALELGAQDRFWDIFPTIRRVVTLDGITPQSTAGGTLWSSADGAFLLLNGLDELPDTQTYQLWLITEDEEAIDSGLITLSPDGPSPIAVELPLNVGEFAAVGLSIEPAGGSDAPTDVVLLGLRS